MFKAQTEMLIAYNPIRLIFNLTFEKAQFEDLKYVQIFIKRSLILHYFHKI